MYKRSARGIASIFAMMMMVVLFTIAMSFASMANMNLLQSSNFAQAATARMQAEGGMSFMLHKLAGVTLSSTTDPNLIESSIYTSLGTQLNGTGNLNGSSVSSSGLVVTVPAIGTGSGSFGATIAVDSNCGIHLSVTGAEANITRTVNIVCIVSGSSGSFSNFGMASKGPISLTGNATLKGANNAQEGSILTEANVTGNDVTMIGNCNVSGDVSTACPDGNVAVTGNIDIGGASGSAIWGHVHLDVNNVPFPTINSAPLVAAVPSWTTVTSATTVSGASLSFKNIWIKAGTNPTFSGNITIQGAVYVESPNVVNFAGNLNFTGVLLTANAGTGKDSTNQVNFLGNTTFAGVESLPNTSDFAQLRNMPGTAVLAPGFQVQYVGNFGTVNGTMAADSFAWTGNASGTVNGEIISYGSSTMSMTGNSIITINKAKYPGTPPGFSGSTTLAPDMDTYAEQ